MENSGVWVRLICWGTIAGGCTWLVPNETSERMAYAFSALGGAAFFIALVQAMRLGIRT